MPGTIAPCKVTNWLDEKATPAELFDFITIWTKEMGFGDFKSGPRDKVSVDYNNEGNYYKVLLCDTREGVVVRSHLSYPDRVRCVVDTMPNPKRSEGQDIKVISVWLAQAEYETKHPSEIESPPQKER